MSLTLDYSNMMADAIGPEHGVLDSELEALIPRARQIHQQLQQRRADGELPFYDLPFGQEMVASVLSFAKQLQQQFKNVVVLGIGGSALGTTALFRALRPLWHNAVDHGERNGLPRLFVFDNVDPDGFSEGLVPLRPEETCFLVISKSGSTVETSCQFLIARGWLMAAVGDQYRDHFVLITDPVNGSLRELAGREGYRSCDIPPGVGGRFSVLTPVGLLPLACAGVDIESLMRGAALISPSVCREDLKSNPAYLNAALQYLAYGKGKPISVMMPYSDKLKDVADWYAQLWAESLGKKFGSDGSICHVGPTPVKALGTTDQHSQVQLYMEGPFDKVVTFLAVEKSTATLEVPGYPEAPALGYLNGHSMAELIRAERQATEVALKKNQRMSCTLSMPELNAENLGRLLFLFEVQTVFAGYLFGVDPLDQPGVEEGKLFTYALMGREGYEEKHAEFLSLMADAIPHKLVSQ